MANTMADAYQGEYGGSLASIPAYTQEVADRVSELKAELKKNRFLLIESNIDNLLRIASYLRAANIMKKAVEKDDIDDANQNKRALQCMDIVTGMLREESISLESFLKGEF